MCEESGSGSRASSCSPYLLIEDGLELVIIGEMQKPGILGKFGGALGRLRRGLSPVRSSPEDCPPHTSLCTQGGPRGFVRDGIHRRPGLMLSPCTSWGTKGGPSSAMPATHPRPLEKGGNQHGGNREGRQSRCNHPGTAPEISSPGKPILCGGAGSRVSMFSGLLLNPHRGGG